MIIMTLLASATSILFIIPAVNASQTMQSILVPTGRFFASTMLLIQLTAWHCMGCSSAKAFQIESNRRDPVPSKH